MPMWKALLLGLYYHASYPYRWRRNAAAARQRRAPVMVLFYHRIADDGAGEWTYPSAVFARQVRWLKRHFDLISLEEAQRRLRGGASARPSVSITFDDGYADNCRAALPLLIAERVPCTYFVSVQNVLEGVPFAHDVARHRPLPPNTLEELKSLAAAGIEIGCHTRTHADLGGITDRGRLVDEVVTAGEDLQKALGRPVRYFAFPFGLHANLNSQVFHLAYEAGYEAVCSAYGGFNFPGEDAFHLQRIPADPEMIRLKNWLSVDPRKLAIRRFEYDGRRGPTAVQGAGRS